MLPVFVFPVNNKVINRKSHTLFRLVPTSVTLNDL